MRRTHYSNLKFVFVLGVLCLFYGTIGYVQAQELTGEERSGRIDIYSENKKFDLREVISNGTVWTPGKNEQINRWYITDLDLRESDKWQELWIEFTPAESGYALVELRGSFFSDLKDNRHEVWVDDVIATGEGASIKNGSFELIGAENNPVDWGWPKSSKDWYSTDGSQARAGKSCILVWHERPVIQRISVKANSRYKISAWFKRYSSILPRIRKPRL